MVNDHDIVNTCVSILLVDMEEVRYYFSYRKLCHEKGLHHIMLGAVSECVSTIFYLFRVNFRLLWLYMAFSFSCCHNI